MEGGNCRWGPGQKGGNGGASFSPVTLKFLVDPHCLPNRRVGKTVPECLGTGRLDRGITRTIARIFAELSKRRLFCRRVAARGWRWRRKKNRKIRMNGGKP